LGKSRGLQTRSNASFYDKRLEAHLIWTRISLHAIRLLLL